MHFADLKNHLNTFCEMRPFKCKFCDLSLPGLKVGQILKQHLQSDCRIRCGKCDQNIPSKTASQHRIDCGKRLIHCSLCSKSFEKEKLETHVRHMSHIQRTLFADANRRIGHFYETGQLVTILENRLCFNKLTGNLISLDFFGGILSLG